MLLSFLLSLRKPWQFELEEKLVLDPRSGNQINSGSMQVLEKLLIAIRIIGASCLVPDQPQKCEEKTFLCL